MNTIRLDPAKGAADTAVNIILNGDVISGIKAEKYNSGLDIKLQGPGSDRLFALSIADCEAIDVGHIGGNYESEGVSRPFSWEVRQSWAPDAPENARNHDSYRYVGYEHTAELSLEPTRWTGVWSIAEYVSAMTRASRTLQPVAEITYHEYEEAMQDRIYVNFPLVVEKHVTLEGLFSLCVGYLPKLEEATRAELSRAEEMTRLVQHFNFPKTVSAACQQYLAYFTQFLADLGIEADAEIHSTAAEVLFRVTPREGPEALGQIREALSAYLQLSAVRGEIVEAEAYTDLAVIQLMANVDHLKSQVRLARAEASLYRAQLDARQAQIEAKDVTIQVLRGQHLGPATTTSAPKPEPLFDGAVTLSKMEKFGVGLDLGVLFRKLKRRWRG